MMSASLNKIYISLCHLSSKLQLLNVSTSMNWIDNQAETGLQVGEELLLVHFGHFRFFMEGPHHAQSRKDWMSQAGCWSCYFLVNTRWCSKGNKNPSPWLKFAVSWGKSSQEQTPLFWEFNSHKEWILVFYWPFGAFQTKSSLGESLAPDQIKRYCTGIACIANQLRKKTWWRDKARRCSSDNFFLCGASVMDRFIFWQMFYHWADVKRVTLHATNTIIFPYQLLYVATHNNITRTQYNHKASKSAGSFQQNVRVNYS